MKKTLRVTLAGLLAFASAAVILPSQAQANICDCVYMATGFNIETNEFTYGWVCPTLPTCNEEKVPEDG